MGGDEGSSRVGAAWESTGALILHGGFEGPDRGGAGAGAGALGPKEGEQCVGPRGRGQAAGGWARPSLSSFSKGGT